jgi:hypothetical protein
MAALLPLAYQLSVAGAAKQWLVAQLKTGEF